MRDVSRPAIWLWPNLLALDAPLIAVVWQDFLCRCLQIPLHHAERAVLALTVWAIYLADRLLDNRLSPPATARHAFARRHREAFLVSLLVSLVAAGAAAFTQLDRVVLGKGLLIGIASLAYLMIFPSRRLSWNPGKKVLAAALFTAGVCLLPAARKGAAGVVVVGLFCLLLGNLALTEAWENHPRGTRGWIWMLILAGVSLWYRDLPWFQAIAVCSILLATLDLMWFRLPSEAGCALADAVLLLPAVIHVK